MDCSIALLLSAGLILGGCEPSVHESQIPDKRQGSVAAVNCSKMPPEFQTFEHYSSGRSYPFNGYLKNVVKIDSEGKIWWNEVELTSQHGAHPLLETYLIAISEMDDFKPLTFLDFEVGAPCSVISKVREMMIEHLQCGRKAECLQGDGRI